MFANERNLIQMPSSLQGNVHAYKSDEYRNQCFPGQIASVSLLLWRMVLYPLSLGFSRGWLPLWPQCCVSASDWMQGRLSLFPKLHSDKSKGSEPRMLCMCSAGHGPAETSPAASAECIS